jgi:glycosyltransferase involved in cell wall biosynthesis
LIVACGAVDVAYLETDVPIMLVLDATHARVCQYYPNYSNLLGQSCRELDSIENRAIRKAALLLYATNWAAQSAIEDYHADPAKVHVVPFGANLDSQPLHTVLAMRKRSDRCRLLFVGVNWERKGGDIAVETLKRLEALNIPAELIVCGCIPPSDVSHPSIRVIPYLNKHDPEQRAELDALYLSSDFLLLPTRNECYGIAFCEASAFGLPAVTTHTGGVPEIVRDGETGFVLPLSARGEAYAAVIARAYGDEARYAELVSASRSAFEDRLNWDAWGTSAAHLIENTLGRTYAPPVSDVLRPG